MYVSINHSKASRLGHQPMALKILMVAAALIFSQGCATMDRPTDPNATLRVLQGIQQMEEYNQKKHFNYVKQQQLMYIRARQGAVPFRPVAPTNTGTSQTYPMAPIQQPAYSNNPSQQFLNNGFKPYGGY